MPTVITTFRPILISLAIFCSCFGPLDPFNPPPDGTDDGGETPGGGFAAGLIAWYTCNDSSTTTLSDTLGKYNAQINGCTHDSGVSGGAKGGLRFNGSGDVVTVKDSVALFGTGDFTVSLWVKPFIVDQITDSTQYNIISNGVAKERGFTISITRNNFSAFVGQSSNESLDTTMSANAGKWRHLVLTRSGITVRLFVDGKNPQTFDSESDVSTNSQLLIGRDASTRQDWYYSGLVDEIKIFSKAWDASDVSKEYQRFSH